MKAIISLAILGMAVSGSAIVTGQSQENSMLKEMEKCAVCKVMVNRPELMKNMTWETHKIDNGMLCLSSVPKEQKKEFDAVHEQMMQAVAKVKADMQQGKPVELCEFCKSMGELEKLNAKQEDVMTKTGGIHLVTSSDPTVVKKIHAVADKAIAEQKKMEQEVAGRVTN